MSAADDLRAAVSAAGECHGWGWVAGYLEGALVDGWDAARTARGLREATP